MAGGIAKSFAAGYDMADKAKKDKEDRAYRDAMKARLAYKKGGKVKKPKRKSK